MRLINKKNLIILTSILLVIISILVLKQTKPVELDEVKLLEASNNTSFAMYKEDGEVYTEVEGNTFPEGYFLNLEKSKCIDSNGSEVKNVLSIKDEKVTLTSNRTTYCYLYFDKNAGLQIREKNPSKLSDTIKGDMYRFQGNASDEIDNYICFGTSDSQICKDHPEQYMYRIIGIEKSGRIKVIKKEALDQPYQWYTDYVTDVKLPETSFFKSINGNDFLDNPTYIPFGWKDKISDNNWLYGDMWNDDNAGAKQESAGLYETESGQKDANWYLWSTQVEGGTPYEVKWTANTVFQKGTILYYKTTSGKWTDTKKAKVSLMNLSDYSYSVGDEAKCNRSYDEEEYSKCKLGWIHLSNNDPGALNPHEWTMSRFGWGIGDGAFLGFGVDATGYTNYWNVLTSSYSVRPVFYIDAFQTLKDGAGKLNDPFIIN